MIARRARVALVGLLLTMPVAAGACGSSSHATTPEADASTGDDAPGPVDEEGGHYDAPAAPGPDASVVRCTLPDMSDPVALCIEKQALQGELVGAYAKGHGVAPSWDALTAAPGAGHSWRDDVGFASSIASYHCNSDVYGDTELTSQLDSVLPDLAKTILSELPQAPSGYDGEDYFRLRNAVAGLYYINDNDDAVAVAQLVDAFGRNLQASYAHSVTWTAPGGGLDGGSGSDGGVEGGADGGGGVDAGNMDAGVGQAMVSVVLGTPAPDGSGAIVYAPAEVVMGAAALLDMARLHAVGGGPSDGGDGGAVDSAQIGAWIATALSSIDYVWARGRDPKTGLLYTELVTSNDPDHDRLGEGTPRPDALRADVQAEAVLGLARAQDLLTALSLEVDGGLPGAADASALQPTYWGYGAKLVEGLVAAGLFDGSTMPSVPPTPGTFMEALLPATGAIDANKATAANAWLLGGFHRIAYGTGSSLAGVLGALRAAFLQQTPAHSSLYSVVTDPASGVAVQTDYLRAASKDFHYATVFSPDAGDAGATGVDGGQEPGATSYRSDAVAAMVEGFTQLWFGRQNEPQCSP